MGYRGAIEVGNQIAPSDKRAELISMLFVCGNLGLSVPVIGVGILFWKGRSPIGWLLTIAGALFILAGVIANMNIFYAPTSLFNTLLMLILLVGGVVLIARSTRRHEKKAEGASAE